MAVPSPRIPGPGQPSAPYAVRRVYACMSQKSITQFPIIDAVWHGRYGTRSTHSSISCVTGQPNQYTLYNNNLSPRLYLYKVISICPYTPRALYHAPKPIHSPYINRFHTQSRVEMNKRKSTRSMRFFLSLWFRFVK